MVQVSSELRRLQEAGSGGRVQEGGATERVAQLEQQLNAFTHQRLQHLELIQNQQLELQVLVLRTATTFTAPLDTTQVAILWEGIHQLDLFAVFTGAAYPSHLCAFSNPYCQPSLAKFMEVAGTKPPVVSQNMAKLQNCPIFMF